MGETHVRRRQDLYKGGIRVGAAIGGRQYDHVDTGYV